MSKFSTIRSKSANSSEFCGFSIFSASQNRKISSFLPSILDFLLKFAILGNFFVSL